MPNINAVIQFLDEYLNKSHREHVDAVEANAMLNKAGLLSDSKDKPGQPLRILLRKGLIPHAYQTGSRWKIPRSGPPGIKPMKSNVKVQLSTSGSTKSITLERVVDTANLKTKLEDARAKYKPKQVKFLLIAEAPPDSIDRFFYYENVTRHDYLFLGVTQAIYPELKEKFLGGGRDPGMKKQILSRFQSDGFYLLDLSDLPLSLLGRDLGSQLPRLAEKVAEIISDKTKIILIKANVFDIAFEYLKDAGFSNVIKKRIPFPGQGGQALFQSGFKDALALAGFRA